MRKNHRVEQLGLVALVFVCGPLSGCGDDGGKTTDVATTGATTSGATTSGTTGTTASTTAGLAETSEASTTAEPTGTPGDGSDGPVTTGTSTTTAPTTGGSGETTADACADSVLTWENFGEPFMLSWCTGCHHSALPSEQRACAPCNVNFDHHAGVHPLAAYIELRVIDWAAQEGVKPMPPAAIVPDDQLALLREYLECGAPGPEVGGVSPSCPDPETVVADCP